MNDIVYHAMFSYHHSPKKEALKASGVGGGGAAEVCVCVCLHVQTCGRTSSRTEVFLEGKQATGSERFAVQTTEVNLCVTPLQVLLANVESSEISTPDQSEAQPSLARKIT